MKIIGLTQNTKDMHEYSTEQLLQQYSHWVDIPERIKEQAKHLGVNRRFLLRPLGDYDEMAERADEAHKLACIRVADDCLSKLDYGLHDIDNIIVASEISDYQTPGMAPTLIRDLGLDNSMPYYNLQGTACSSMPRILELARNLMGNTLCIINGCTSDMYQMEVQALRHGPSSIEPKTPQWVKLMFACLFGDATAAFVCTHDLSQHGWEVHEHEHIVNLDRLDYQKASVQRSLGFTMYANPDINRIALEYTDKVLQLLGIEDLSSFHRIVLHTGSTKIIEGYKNHYGLSCEQVHDSVATLNDYGNTTGCSLPLVLNRGTDNENSLMIGITMGFGLDIIKVKRDVHY